MNRPLYRGAPQPQKGIGNAGLMFDKYCDLWNEGFDELEKENKRAWYERFAGLRGDQNALNETHDRRVALVEALGGRLLYLRLETRLAVGLGRANPGQNGMTWHHTLGVPYLPGGSVKGALRSWAEQWTETPPELSQRLFGPRRLTDEQPGNVGAVLILDLLPRKPVTLAVDNMTPHYGAYYSAADGTAPGDWFSPIPIPFLTVMPSAVFTVALLPGKPVSQEDMDQVEKWLVDGLDALGAGAKTSAGYGRFVEDHETKKADQARRLDRQQRDVEARATQEVRLRADERLVEVEAGVKSAALIALEARTLKENWDDKQTFTRIMYKEWEDIKAAGDQQIIDYFAKRVREHLPTQWKGASKKPAQVKLIKDIQEHLQ